MSARDVIAKTLDESSPHGLVDGGEGEADNIIAALAAAGYAIDRRDHPSTGKAEPPLQIEAATPVASRDEGPARNTSWRPPWEKAARTVAFPIHLMHGDTVTVGDRYFVAQRSLTLVADEGERGGLTVEEAQDLGWLKQH